MNKHFEYDENDPRLYEEQYEAWLLCADTIQCDITTYPGRGDEQSTKPTHNVITKKNRRHE